MKPLMLGAGYLLVHMFQCMKDTKYDICICLLEMNYKFTKIRLKYYFSSIPYKLSINLYGQVEIETKYLIFHFAFLEFIALIPFFLVDTKKTNRNLYSCKRKRSFEAL